MFAVSFCGSLSVHRMLNSFRWFMQAESFVATLAWNGVERWENELMLYSTNDSNICHSNYFCVARIYTSVTLSFPFIQNSNEPLKGESVYAERATEIQAFSIAIKSSFHARFPFHIKQQLLNVSLISCCSIKWNSRHFAINVHHSRSH